MAIEALPAYCPKHGIVPFRGVSIGTGADDIQFTNSETSCPIPGCGRRSRILDGRYSAASQVYEVLADADLPPGALAALQDLLERAQNSRMPISVVKAEAERISPKLGKLFDIQNWNSDAKAILLAGLISAAAQFGAAWINRQGDQPAAPITVNTYNNYTTIINEAPDTAPISPQATSTQTK